MLQVVPMVLKRKGSSSYYECSVCGFSTGIPETWMKHINEGCIPPPGEGLTPPIKKSVQRNLGGD
jgi:hypothetical protein